MVPSALRGRFRSREGARGTGLLWLQCLFFVEHLPLDFVFQTAVERKKLACSRTWSTALFQKRRFNQLAECNLHHPQPPEVRRDAPPRQITIPRYWKLVVLLAPSPPEGRLFILGEEEENCRSWYVYTLPPTSTCKSTSYVIGVEDMGQWGRRQKQ